MLFPHNPGRWALGLALLCLATACNAQPAAPAASPAAGEGATATGPAQPKVNRLVMAVETPLIESNENRHLSPPYSWVLRPMYEHLIGIDPTNGRMIPQLATEWKVEPDGSSFRFKLRGDVQFHGGFGQFTAADVVEPWKQVIRDDSLAGSASFWRQVIKDIQVAGPTEAVYQLKRPDGNFLASLSGGRSSMEVYSKRAFDQKGPPVDMDAGPLPGTGPYQFKARAQSQWVRFERVPFQHWRAQPAFPEFEYRHMKEPSTRLAALLAGEVQLADLPQDLRGQAVARGYKALAGKASSFRVFLRHFCCYLNDPNDTTKGWMHPNSPLMDVRFRKALSKAIDRNELNKAFFGGEGTVAASVQINATRPGWDPTWERRFQDEYGYDPDAARKLLAEAGYGPNNPATTYIQLDVGTGFTGSRDVSEAIVNYWNKVGVKAELLSMDGNAFDQLTRQMRADNHSILNGSGSDQWTASTTYGSTEGNRRGGVELPKANGYLKEIANTLDEAKQDQLWRQVGEEYFTQHKEIPLFWLPVVAVADPKVVADWVFPGSLTGSFSHVENIKPAG